MLRRPKRSKNEVVAQQQQEEEEEEEEEECKMLYSFFWVIPRLLNFMYRHFGALCSVHIVGVNRKKGQY